VHTVPEDHIMIMIKISSSEQHSTFAVYCLKASINLRIIDGPFQPILTAAFTSQEDRPNQWTASDWSMGCNSIGETLLRSRPCRQTGRRPDTDGSAADSITHSQVLVHACNSSQCKSIAPPGTGVATTSVCTPARASTVSAVHPKTPHFRLGLTESTGPPPAMLSTPAHQRSVSAEAGELIQAALHSY
jgi:hypothetical protein